MTQPLTVGVEEEFFIVDSATRNLLPQSGQIITSALAQVDEQTPSRFCEEFRPCMVESRSGICRTLDELRADVITSRSTLIRAAEEAGGRIAAAGTYPLADWRTQEFNTKPQYQRTVETYRLLADELLICGCHVHVGVADRDTAVEVMNRVRPWLPVLSALAASSPFWMGADTGYSSYRSMVWERWPTSGMPPTFRSYDEYQNSVRLSVESGISPVAGDIFWDVRPGTQYQTVEFRIADSCATADEVILQAGLCRALVHTTLTEIEKGDTPADIRSELLRAAKWRSTRFGLTDRLLDPFTAALVPAHEMVDRLCEHVRPSLEGTGDWTVASGITERIKRQGTSAERQRAVFERRKSLEDIVDHQVRDTASW
ncbi:MULTISPECIES: glutamate--cysteine ligase [unclassified Streptomyces]|uniref:carboxylate-amine ligase n=1 Tax=unclassified Streptomyces TaxID=2593676 RepID=UPI00093E9ED5|nr:glutamate--cysteine ligase [Streptomyces sp. TSRI0281]OKI46329.1 hypothetical protein A6A29_29840 [Streptomyces sp. TSRI0281]